jgi:hypothetical protein
MVQNILEMFEADNVYFPLWISSTQVFDLVVIRLLRRMLDKDTSECVCHLNDIVRRSVLRFLLCPPIA